MKKQFQALALVILGSLGPAAPAAFAEQIPDIKSVLFGHTAELLPQRVPLGAMLSNLQSCDLALDIGQLGIRHLLETIDLRHLCTPKYPLPCPRVI